ncbi:MAG TPA: MBL fold metallo-hydrolase, partial [Deltaproteobacteria bacterium]|nr:MBL fold metallo-hydrolase [Deltaproteobacteria bacterium]
MIVKIWGARGSIPVCGQEYIRYGGDTTCIEIRSKNGRVIIVDSGTGIRRLGKSLLTEG